MNYGSVLKDAWAVLRKAPSLWWLGLVSAASQLTLVLVVMVIAAVAILPMTVIILDAQPTLLQDTSDASVSNLYSALDSGLVFIGSSLGLIYGVVGLLVIVWFFLAIAEIAAMGGLVTAVDRVGRGEEVTAREAFASGMKYWWRTAAIWALAILPQMLYALVITGVLWLTVSAPLMVGDVPSVDAMTSGSAFTQPLGLLANFASLALGVLVAMALRFGLINDEDWRAAVSEAWRFVKQNLKPTAIMFGALWVVSWAVGAVTALVQGILLIFVGAIGIFVFYAGWSGWMVLGMILLGAFMLLIAALVQASLAVYKSAAWTVFWRASTRAG